jgi:hypothetical protein
MAIVSDNLELLGIWGLQFVRFMFLYDPHGCALESFFHSNSSVNVLSFGFHLVNSFPNARIPLLSWTRYPLIPLFNALAPASMLEKS